MLSRPESGVGPLAAFGRLPTAGKLALLLGGLLIPLGLVAALALGRLIGEAEVQGTRLVLLLFAMWVGAGLASWLLTNRLLLRPIVRLRNAIHQWRPQDGTMRVPTIATPAREIRDLGAAFSQTTADIGSRETDLAAGVARQRALLREVHHRVKNNLQVVASLLNLHARGARTPDAAAAYAAILRRVDALAVVHRNHYAEMEDSRGLPLRTLLSELTANLRGNATPGAERMAIALDVDAAAASQDVAVSVAFLVTEIVEYAMLCAPESTVDIALRRDGPTARLSLHSDGLRTDLNCEEVDARQFERVTAGLARQLRSTLHRDGETGYYAIDIPILDEVGDTL